jgi:hypothetical protein
MTKKLLIPKEFASAHEYALHVLNSPDFSKVEKNRWGIQLLAYEAKQRAAARPGKKEIAADRAQELGSAGKFATPEEPKPSKYAVPPPPKHLAPDGTKKHCC